MNIDDRNKNNLVLGEGPTQGLDIVTITAEAKYRINFTESGNLFVLSLDYNGSNSFWFANAVKMYLFKAKHAEIKPYLLCNISKDFRIDDMKKIRLKGSVRLFSANDNAIGIRDILDIHKFLMKETQYKRMFGIIKKMFIVLLTSIVNASNHTKYVSLIENVKFNLLWLIYILNEYSQELHYYPFWLN